MGERANGGQTMTIIQRAWGETHGAGVAPGTKPIDHTFTRINSQTFAQMEVGKDTTEIILEP